jgi:hypothetical protein
LAQTSKINAAYPERHVLYYKYMLVHNYAGTVADCDPPPKVINAAGKLSISNNFYDKCAKTLL